MTKTNIFLGKTPLSVNDELIRGEYVFVNAEKFYKISNYEQMPPFFINLVSHTDHWLFTSSNGGLTAGRGDENSALFPYYTEDKITNSADISGSKTLFKIFKDSKIYLWEPFRHGLNQYYEIRRSLYKNVTRNTIIYEEINKDLKMRFTYAWQFSEKYGIIKKSSITNVGKVDVEIEFIDGLQNIMPHGVSADLQNASSNLVNAYKRSELEQNTGIGIFALSAIIIDKAEPSEALKATSVWCTRKKPKSILLSDRQLGRFYKNEPIQTENDIKATPGAYLIHESITLKQDQTEEWQFVAEVNQSQADIVNLGKEIKNNKKIVELLNKDVELGTNTLKTLVGKADGLQISADELSTGRHYANVLFNIMRGGIFEDDYLIEKEDYVKHVRTFNKNFFKIQKSFFDDLPEHIQYKELLEKVAETKNSDIIRITYEYLPLTFSRRHGDPSRPWNKFSIPGRDKNGKNKKNYQGNWRDIFQNWEALALSYPDYIVGMITKFVNASTIDGYNPYRITRNGIDWEVSDPDDPWSYIGYWGDHQIIYLLKLMELAYEYKPDLLAKLLSKESFVYANVPYRIKNYNQLIENPKDTIVFQLTKHKKIIARAEEIGVDGKLVYDLNNQILKANLAEKILVSLLTKFTNFIPGAGIWLNTQRPEWNDANNALVGNGVSMVTLYYMRRYVAFCKELFGRNNAEKYNLNRPVVDLLNGIYEVFQQNQKLLSTQISDKVRRKMVDDLGRIGEKYRVIAYNAFDSHNQNVSITDLQSFFTLALKFIDYTIDENKRADELYHSYNLVDFKNDKAEIKHLYEMLEGQVAVLTSGKLSAEEALSVLDALKNSAMYREDQYSYILYPNKNLPGFLEKNTIPKKFVESSKLVQKLIEKHDHSIVEKDNDGNYHFNGDFHNATYLEIALDKLLEGDLAEYIDHEKKAILEVYEQMFNHKAFTGRSGTFFGYEGLGSIYWHMVSKLLLSVQENIKWGKEKGADEQVIGRLIDHYYEIRAGIGINKSPGLYGAFPTDPYSHTPAHRGAQQPGMTGQVKEDVLNRFAELGLKVENHCICFEPLFLNTNEFMNASSNFEYVDLNGGIKTLRIEPETLAFTYCQTPIIYKKSDKNIIHVAFNNGEVQSIKGCELNKTLSSHIFMRTGKIARIDVELIR